MGEGASKCFSGGRKNCGFGSAPSEPKNESAELTQAAVKIQSLARKGLAKTKVKSLRVQLGVGCSAETAGELRNSVEPGTVIVCVLGGSSSPEVDELVAAVAFSLGLNVSERVAFVTRGRPGAEEVFAKNCGEGESCGEKVWNMVPLRTKSNFIAGTDQQIGTDAEKCMDIFGKIGDIYLTVGADADIAEMARNACSAGAVVLPLALLGAEVGPSAFPPEALERPSSVDSSDWEVLMSEKATALDTAQAVANAIDALLTARAEALQAFMVAETERLRAVARWKQVGKTIRLAKSCTETWQRGAFNVVDAVGEEAAAEAIEEEFEVLSAQWKPSAARGGAVKAADCTEEPQAPDVLAMAADLVSEPSQRDAKLATKLKGPAPPPPPRADPSGDARAEIDFIEEAKQRIADRVAAVEQKVTNATTRLQAAHRGKQARVTVKVLMALKNATPSQPHPAGTGEDPGGVGECGSEGQGGEADRGAAPWGRPVATPDDDAPADSEGQDASKAP